MCCDRESILLFKKRIQISFQLVHLILTCLHFLLIDRQTIKQIWTNKHTNQINRQTCVVRSAARSAVGRAVVLKSSSKSSGHSCPENPISYSFWKKPDKPARLSLSICQAQQKWKQILRRKQPPAMLPTTSSFLTNCTVLLEYSFCLNRF